MRVFSRMTFTPPKRKKPHGTAGQAHPAGTDEVRTRWQGSLAVQMRPIEEPAVLRRLAQADAGRDAGQAVLVRRRGQAARDGRPVPWHPYLLAAPWRSRRG